MLESNGCVKSEATPCFGFDLCFFVAGWLQFPSGCQRLVSPVSHVGGSFLLPQVTQACETRDARRAPFAGFEPAKSATELAFLSKQSKNEVSLKMDIACARSSSGSMRIRVHLCLRVPLLVG